MEVKFKKLCKEAVIPTKAHKEDAGFDLTATSIKYDDYGNVVYGTGIAMEIPSGHVGLLFPRSSNSKHLLTLCNSVGVLDSCYRGEIMFKFSHNRHITRPHSLWEKVKMFFGSNDFKGSADVTNLCSEDYNVGERIGQLIILPYPEIEFKEVEELSESDRGEGGFGSSGK